MILDQPTITRLLGSIEANRLVLLCGAGLSIPAPSKLMSAVAVSRACYDKYRHIEVLPATMRDGIDELAGHFHGTGQFDSVFIGSLVPWDDLTGEPNVGHAAVSDLLISRAADSALSANFDCLIEQCANKYKVDLQGALEGHEALAFRSSSNPLLKFHGCMLRDRTSTLWTQLQLREAQIAERIRGCADWMRLTLPGKDLLVVGFWTDWGYLNDVIAEALNTMAFGSVTVVDIATSGDLQTKAPNLWATLMAGTTQFLHIRESGADALAELRAAFSDVWIKKFYALAAPLLAAEGKASTSIAPPLSIEDKYDCRRDAEGIPYDRAPRTKEPLSSAAQASFFHHLLLHGGATREGAWYKRDGKRVRIVQGGGEGLNSVRHRYKEPPALDQPDIVVCAGAWDVPVPGSIVGSTAASTVVRVGTGSSPQWLTLEQARAELAV
jgi:hypothetical protein